MNQRLQKLRTPGTIPHAVARIMGSLTPPVAAAVIGKSERLVYGWSDPDSDSLPSIEQAMTLDAAMKRATGETPILAVYQQALEVIDTPADVGPTSPLECLARLTKEVGEVSGAVLSSFADDGKIDQRERHLIETELHQLKGAIQQMLDCVHRTSSANHLITEGFDGTIKFPCGSGRTG